MLKRWTKDTVLIDRSKEIENTNKINRKDIGVSSVWRSQMIRKFSKLISASEWNPNAQEYVHEGFKMTRDKIVAKVESYYIMIRRMNGHLLTLEIRLEVG